MLYEDQASEDAGIGSLVHRKAPQVCDLEGEDGARGIRTPKPFRALAFEASAIPFCQRSRQLCPNPSARGRWIRADTTSGARIGHGMLGRVGRCSNLRFSSGRPLQTIVNRGARIRTGDLCDPNAALYRTEPHPGNYLSGKTTAGGD